MNFLYIFASPSAKNREKFDHLGRLFLPSRPVGYSLKDRLWVHIKTASPRVPTESFESKVRKIVYLCISQLYYIYVRACIFDEHVIFMIRVNMYMCFTRCLLSPKIFFPTDPTFFLTEFSK